MLIDLDNQAALVLFELLASREEELFNSLKLEAAERNALWLLEGALEKTLVEPFDPNYESLVIAARESLVERLGG